MKEIIQNFSNYMKSSFYIKDIGRASMKVNVEVFLFLLVSVSYVLQPINVRPLSIPVSLFLLTFLSLHSFFKAKYKIEDIAFLVPVFLILFVHDYLLNQQSRSLVFLFLLLLIINYRQRTLPVESLRLIWRVIGWSCLVVTIVGYYRFFTGYKSALSENTDGFLGVVDQYFYMGISYLPSTRNSDAVYFSVATLVFLWKLRNRIGNMLINIGSFYISFSAAMLSMSRGIWIALLIAMFVSYKSGFIIRIILPATVAAFITFAIFYPFVFEMIFTSFISIFDPESANRTVSGFYSYSNSKRVEIYWLAIHDIFSFPFGYGVSFIPSYSSVLEDLTSVHSENIYLDLMIIFGVFSIPAFLFIFRLLVKLRQLESSDLNQISKSMIYFLVVYHVFNSGIDFTFAWFVFLVAVLSVNQKLRERRQGGSLNLN